MTVTYDSIATTTLSSPAANITFSSIPATYTDLRVVCVATGSGNFGARVNGDTGANYMRTDLTGSGSAVSTFIPSAFQSYIVVDNALGGLGTTPYLFTLDFFSYANSLRKTILITANEDNNGSGYVSYQAALWNTASAINSVTVLGSSTLNAGTIATLYGIKAE
jgi:hypothetical protein